MRACVRTGAGEALPLRVVQGLCEQRRFFHPNGALLNPHAASQLSHFAPITCVTTEAISQADRLDICRILLHLDPNEMLVRSSAGDINDLAAVDIDAVIAAQHESMETVCV